MRILCCTAARFRQETRESLARYAPDAEVIDVSGDHNAYWFTVRDRWNGQDSLLIIEQDIEFTPYEIVSVRDCPQDWCVFGYHHVTDNPALDGTILDNGIGFTRFSAEMMKKVPVDQIPCNAEGTVHWTNLDARLLCAGFRYGFRPHVHGRVEHHHYASGQ